MSKILKKYKKECLWILVLLTAFLVLTYFVVTSKTSKIDEAAFNLLIKLKCRPVTGILYVITKIGSSLGVVIVLLISLIPFIKTKKLSDFKYVLINTMLGVLLMKGIKEIVRRTRPSWKWIKEGGYSYPSGHTISAVLLYGTLLLIVNKNVHGKLRKPLIVFLSIMMFLIPISRIYFGVHYLTDVLASTILGIIILIITNIIMDKEYYIHDKNKDRKTI